MNKKNILLILIICTIALAARLIPHLPNFSPLASIALFTGVYGQSKKYIILPLATLFISDLFIGFYKLEVMLSVYLSIAIISLIGWWIKKNKNLLTISSSVLASSLLFFLITNFAVWYFGSWYSHDLAGLTLCYNLAIPFFRTTLLSDIFYSLIIFGAWEAVALAIRHKKLAFTK